MSDFFGDIKAGFDSLTNTVSGIANKAGDVRVSYDKVLNAVGGVAVAPTAIATTRGDTPSRGIVQGEAAIDRVVNDSGEWYKNPKVLLSAVGGLMVLLLILRLTAPRGR